MQISTAISWPMTHVTENQIDVSSKEKLQE